MNPILISSYFSLLNDCLVISNFVTSSFFFIVYLAIHLSRERRSFRKNLKENLDSYEYECLVRKYEIAKAKYSLMLALCILELVISSSISIPDIIYEVSRDIKATTRTKDFPYDECVSDPILPSLCKLYGRIVYIIGLSCILALLFLSRSLCLSLNNVYTERKQITNFKSWFPTFVSKVTVVNILAVFQQTLPLQFVLTILVIIFEFYLLVREMNNLNHSIILRNFELRRDYPNSIATLKSCNDIKYFQITSKFTLTHLFFFYLTIIIWIHIESFLSLAFNYPCYLHYLYGIGSEYNYMIIARHTAESIYLLFHYLQNISLLIANLTILSLYVLLITHSIVSLHKRRSSAYALQRPQLITSLLETNTQCYKTKNNML